MLAVIKSGFKRHAITPSREPCVWLTADAPTAISSLAKICAAKVVATVQTPLALQRLFRRRGAYGFQRLHTTKVH